MSDVDLRALLAFYGGGDGRWSALMLAATLLGGGWAALAVLPLLAYARTRAFALALAAGITAQAVLVWALKALVGRVRPWIALGLPAPFGHPTDGSFPSGHAAGSACVAAFLLVALPAIWPDAPGRARLVGGAAVLAAAWIAASRVYLGAHFPTDVLAGAVLGACIGGAAAMAYVRGRATRGTVHGAGEVERAPERG